VRAAHERAASRGPFNVHERRAAQTGLFHEWKAHPDPPLAWPGPARLSRTAAQASQQNGY